MKGLSIKDTPGIIVSTEQYFSEIVAEGIIATKVNAPEVAAKYIADMLVYFMDVRNLYDLEDNKGKLKRETLAEMMLKSTHLPLHQRVKVLKRLGDISLYVSGFFSSSLNRKLIDQDYYQDMGGLAYAHLASYSKDDTMKVVFEEFSDKFSVYVGVLQFISEKASVQNDENVLRLFDRYVKTGSELIKERLSGLGLDVNEDQALKYRLVKQ